MPSSALIYTLLFFWTLPAVALIGFYIFVLVREGNRDQRAWSQFSLWKSTAPMELVPEGVRPTFTHHRPSGEFPIIESPPGLQGKENHARHGGTANHLHVPLVIEDREGNLHMRSWHLCLN